MSEASLWYDNQSVGLGARFLSTFGESLRQISLAPQRAPLLEGLPSSRGVRRIRLAPFPYLVVYAVANEQVTVVAVSHASRRPFYWLPRLKRGE
ncbi:MAG: type II toxin-antitoxin system RelE/ParE family toxin [Planctomycetes bacterium]|nr:type II toxin-antitoxin system RelE/ParE family toxin [Planctomycetota bacterium]